MLIKKPNDVPATEVKMDGAEGASVRVIFGPDDNAPTFAMRIFELVPGGHTPFHTHAFEHEIVILDGDVAITTEQGDKPVQKGDMVLVNPNEKHQFKNRSGAKEARFMCLVPIAYQK